MKAGCLCESWEVREATPSSTLCGGGKSCSQLLPSYLPLTSLSHSQVPGEVSRVFSFRFDLRTKNLSQLKLNVCFEVSEGEL